MVGENKKFITNRLIGYLSPTDPHKDRFAWSGTYFNTCKAIEDAGYQVDWIPSYDKGKFFKIKLLFYKALHYIFYGKGSFDNSTLASKLRSQCANKHDLDQYDFIFVPAQSEVIARLKTNRPIIHYSDATVSRMINYYWFGWSQKAIKDANKIEQQTINKVSINILSSHWAAESVINEYHAPKEMVYVLPFGEGIDANKITPSSAYHGGRLNILFSGVDWNRKGGGIAIDAVKKLIKDGYEARLYICGIRDLNTEIGNLDFVENLGFLSKNNPDQYQKYLEAWHHTHLFLLPTRAECSAIVFCEANAYGVPIITTETGGTGDYVINDVNGYRMSLKATGDAYAAKIEEWINTDRFNTLHEGALKMYQESTSCKAWGRAFQRIVSEKLCSQHDDNFEGQITSKH